MVKTKSNPLWLSFLESAAISCITYMGFHLLLALCVVKGTVPEHYAVICLTVLCGFSSMLGALLAIRRISGLSRLIKSLLSTACFCTVLILLAFVLYGSITLKGSGGLLLGSALLGGIAANLFSKGKKLKRTHRHS